MNKKKNSLKDPQLHGDIAIPHDKIVMRAYDKWCKRGCPPGTERQDWVEAEIELRAEIAAEAKKRVQSSTERGSKRPTRRSVPHTPERAELFELLDSLLKDLDSEEETVREDALAKFSFFAEETELDSSGETLCGVTNLAKLSFFLHEALPRIINALNDNSARVRAMTRRLFFATYRSFRFSPSLRKALESGESKVRLEAIQEIVRVLPDAKNAIAAGWRGWESLALLTVPQTPEEPVGPPGTKGDEPSEDSQRRHAVTEDPMHRPRKKSAGRGLSQSPPQAAKPEVENAGEQLEEGQSEQPDSNHGAVQWKPWLDSYQDLRALQFRTPEHFAAAAKLLWTGELRDLPYDLVGCHTIIVPAEAVPFFRGLEVTETDVLHPCDMPPQELSELRKEQGPY